MDERRALKDRVMLADLLRATQNARENFEGMIQGLEQEVVGNTSAKIKEMKA
jgi:hypothetical protein